MKSSANPAALAADPLVLLGEQTRAGIDQWLKKFPPERKRSALLRALFLAQQQNQGHLSDELIAAVANYLELPPTWAFEVASFYSMLHVGSCGRNKVSVCTNISCWLNGGEELLQSLEQKLGIKRGESTPDGRVHLVHEEECLAACVRAPMMMVNGDYHEHLTHERAAAIVDALR
jgi:NADH-quinone oxidoreductase subunit E